jgi:hypothetical protein
MCHLLDVSNFAPLRLEPGAQKCLGERAAEIKAQIKREKRRREAAGTKEGTHFMILVAFQSDFES